jgi:hypothetical protein
MSDLKEKFPIKDTSNSSFFEVLMDYHFRQSGSSHAFESGLNEMRQRSMERLIKQKMEEEMNELQELKTVQLIINFVVVMAILAVAVTVGRYLG